MMECGMHGVRWSDSNKCDSIKDEVRAGRGRWDVEAVAAVAKAVAMERQRCDDRVFQQLFRRWA